MAAKEANVESLKEAVETGDIVLVDFWAEWCGPCKMFAPIFEKASEKHEDVHFLKVNTEEQRELAQEFQISAIPTLALFRDNVLLFKQAGMLPGPALDDLIAQVKELDMAEVHKKIAEAEADDAEA